MVEMEPSPNPKLVPKLLDWLKEVNARGGESPYTFRTAHPTAL